MSTQELNALLSTCDIPEARRDTSKNDNVRWLCRNLLVRNSGNVSAHLAMALLKKLALVQSGNSAY